MNSTFRRNSVSFSDEVAQASFSRPESPEPSILSRLVDPSQRAPSPAPSVNESKSGSTTDVSAVASSEPTLKPIKTEVTDELKLLSPIVEVQSAVEPTFGAALPQVESTGVSHEQP